jgi:hypothetical protein
VGLWKVEKSSPILTIVLIRKVTIADT